MTESPLRVRTSEGPAVSDRLAAAASGALVGRADERSRLTRLLDPDGPAVVFVHGPGGIGKTALVTGTLAALPVNTLTLDGRAMEPTARGALAAVGSALAVPTPSSAAEGAQAVSEAGVDVVVIDSFERLNLLDGWIRNELATALPATVSTLLVGRRGPNVAWRTAPGWRQLIGELVVGAMSPPDLDALLARYDVPPEEAARIRDFARGHPLAAVVAAEALVRHPGLPLGSGPPAEVVEEIFEVLLDDLAVEEREAVEAAAVLRRVTLPLLAAVVEQDVENAWRALRTLPFTTTTSAGIELAGVAQSVISEAVELRDPLRVRSLRANAARAILAHSSGGLDWASCADLLHLVENPLIRNAYKPPGSLQHPVEQARSEDRSAVVDIIERFAGPESARWGELWWSERRDAFTVTRAPDGGVAAFALTTPVDEVTAALADDPVVVSVAGHLRRRPLPQDGRALLLRWSLGRQFGELSTAELASLIVDVKRTYLAMRPGLRRVYTSAEHWDQVGQVLRVMGFDVVDDIDLGDRRATLAVLDFGPRGVDGWLAAHVLAEQGEPSAVPGQGDAEPAPLFALTPREREVLALLADGMTNARLAETLFISERTANRHVSNIFTKLGVRNRTQAARVAVDAGLAS